MRYIYHHLGLGDHIICNGMVRYFKEQQKEIKLFCLHKNYENVSYLFRDDPNITFIPKNNDFEVKEHIIKEGVFDKTIVVGFDKMSYNNDLSFDEDFYKLAGLPFEYRFSKFFFRRDENLEREVCDELNPMKEKYIFIHGNLDREKIRKDLKIIENPKQFGIMSLISLLEEAEEIHIEESSIKCLINSFKIIHPKIYFHTYVRLNYPYLHSKGLNPMINI